MCVVSISATQTRRITLIKAAREKVYQNKDKNLQAGKLQRKKRFYFSARCRDGRFSFFTSPCESHVCFCAGIIMIITLVFGARTFYSAGAFQCGPKHLLIILPEKKRKSF
jgi:hypothetical protein